MPWITTGNGKKVFIKEDPLVQKTGLRFAAQGQGQLPNKKEAQKLNRDIERAIHQHDVTEARRTFGQKPTTSQVRAIHEQERLAIWAKSRERIPR